jgi:hypothetical protein
MRLDRHERTAPYWVKGPRELRMSTLGPGGITRSRVGDDPSAVSRGSPKVTQSLPAQSIRYRSATRFLRGSPIGLITRIRRNRRTQRKTPGARSPEYAWLRPGVGWRHSTHR